MPQYSKIQFIAYEVPTLQLAGPGNFARPAAPVAAIDPLYHTWNLADNDARNRVLRLVKAADFARTTGAASLGGADTLKVFVAPEFYFRDAASLEGYTSQSTVNNLYAALLAAFKQDVYKDWLIVPGSIFWSQTTPQSAYLNTVMAIRGRAADIVPSGVASAVPVVTNGTTNQKALMSHIDYAFDPTTGAKVDKRRDDAAINPYFAPIFGDWAWQKGHLFTVQDITGPGGKPLTFGLEVCLEHAEASPTQKTNGALRNALNQWAQNETAALPVIDVHILTSCGMSLRPRNVCAKAGGYAIACDGFPAPTSRIAPVTAQAGGVATLGANLGEAWHQQVPDALKLGNSGTEVVRIYNTAALT